MEPGAGLRPLEDETDFAELHAMSLGTTLVIILVLLLIGAFPSWGYSRSWGYGPSGILGFVLIVVLILLLLGRI